MSFLQAFLLLYQPSDSPFILHSVKNAETPESGITLHPGGLEIIQS